MSNQFSSGSAISNAGEPMELSLDELMLVQGGWNPFKALKNLAEDAVEVVGNVVEDVADAVGDAAEAVGGAIVDAAEATADFARDGAEATWDFVTGETFRDIVDVIFKQPSPYPFPREPGEI